MIYKIIIAIMFFVTMCIDAQVYFKKSSEVKIEKGFLLGLTSTLPLSFNSFTIGESVTPISMSAGYGETIQLLRYEAIGDLTKQTPIVGIGINVNTGLAIVNSDAKAIFFIGGILSFGPIFFSGGYNLVGGKRMICVGYVHTFSNIVELKKW